MLIAAALPAAALALVGTSTADEIRLPAVPGYADNSAVRDRLERIARSPLARIRSLGRTRQDRDIWLLTIAPPRPVGTPAANAGASGAWSTDLGGNRPSLLIVAGLDAPQLHTTQLALRLAEEIVVRAEEAARAGPRGDESAQDEPGRGAPAASGRLLERMTIHVIPLASPDAAERFFLQPYCDAATNFHPRDDDGDGRRDEDPPDDLNGDGWITRMRIEDPAGRYIVHPADERLLIEADPERGERGRWRLMTEGLDNDGDRRFNEDPIGGVALDRNFPFDYPYFAPGAGEFQVSEPETQAVADFVFDHAELAAVLTFCPRGNLLHLPPSVPAGKQGRIKTKLLSADSPYLAHLGKIYRKLHPGDDPPKGAKSGGTLADWAYFHSGRWSLTTPGWWPPKLSEAVDREPDPPAEEADVPEQPDDQPEKESANDDKRAADQRRLLAWLESNSIDGFVPWQRVEHPDFPGRRVEVGGLKPLITSNPPLEQLEPLVAPHVEFLERLAALLPRLELTDATACPATCKWNCYCPRGRRWPPGTADIELHGWPSAIATATIGSSG